MAFESGAAPAQTHSILDAYVRTAPSDQNALDIFKGEWASKLPPPLDHLSAGPHRLFEDGRVAWGLPLLGGVQGRRVLELGPLEGAHTYLMSRAGAAEVLAVEANTRAYLKCLLVKELLRLQRCRFLCGDFVAYLKEEPAEHRFDVCLAMGVLYHMLRPAELLELICRRCDSLLLWTHFFDAGVMTTDPRFAGRFADPLPATQNGFAHVVYPDQYSPAELANAAFCGGPERFRAWMSREDILRCLRHFGMEPLAVQDDLAHPHAPALTLVARRRD